MPARLAALVAMALLLAGCVAVPPPGPSEAEIAEYNAELLDLTWAATGLEGVVDRPATGSGRPLQSAAWFDATFACMSAQGIGNLAITSSSESGFELYGAWTDADDQLAFYRCAAANPIDPAGSLEVLTDDQLDYIYDYYLQSLVPCMVLNGFAPTSAPTRVEFHALAGQWSPYYSVDVGLGRVQYEEIESICGAERPLLY